MCETSSISKLSEKCKICPRVSFCKEKRMEMCAYLIPSNMQNLVADNVCKPNLRDIKIDANTTVTIDMDDIAKALTKSLSINCGCF